MWSLMQWWSNPRARSHLEAWVNIWVRSAGLALVLAGWLLVGAAERERERERGRERVFFLILLFFFPFVCCACMRISCDEQIAKCPWRMLRASAQRYCIFLDCFLVNMPQIGFCNYFVYIRRGLVPANFVFFFFLNQ